MFPTCILNFAFGSATQQALWITLCYLIIMLPYMQLNLFRKCFHELNQTRRDKLTRNFSAADNSVNHRLQLRQKVQTNKETCWSCHLKWSPNCSSQSVCLPHAMLMLHLGMSPLLRTHYAVNMTEQNYSESNKSAHGVTNTDIWVSIRLYLNQISGWCISALAWKPFIQCILVFHPTAGD